MASNRGPVSYQFGADGSLAGQRGGGGMIAGVTEGLVALGPEASVTWICTALSDADRVAAALQHAAAREGVHEEDGIGVRMLDIPPAIFERAYNNVANSALWFVHHLLFDTPNQPQFGHEFRRDWESTWPTTRRSPTPWPKKPASPCPRQPCPNRGGSSRRPAPRGS